MKYPCVISTSTPRGLIAWFGEQLDRRGIDSTLYTRYVLSLLLADTLLEDYHHECYHLPQFVYREYFPVRQGRRKSWYYHKAEWDFCYCASSYTFESRKSEALECLKSATEQVFGLEDLIEELCEKLQKWKAGFDPFDKEKLESPPVTPPPSPKEHQQKYYDAFPSLNEKQSHGKSTNKSFWGQKYPSTNDYDKSLLENKNIQKTIIQDDLNLKSSLLFKKVRKSPKKKHVLEHNICSHLVAFKAPEKRRNYEMDNNFCDDSIKLQGNDIGSLDSNIIKICSSLKSPEKRRKLSYSSKNLQPSTVSHITFTVKPLNVNFLKPNLKIDVSINIKASQFFDETFLKNEHFENGNSAKSIFEIPQNEKNICTHYENTLLQNADLECLKAFSVNILDELFPLPLFLSESLKKISQVFSPKPHLMLQERLNLLKVHNSSNNLDNANQLQSTFVEKIGSISEGSLFSDGSSSQTAVFADGNLMHMFEWKEVGYYLTPSDETSTLRGKDDCQGDIETELVYTKTNKPLASNSNWTFQTNGFHSSRYNISHGWEETPLLTKNKHLLKEDFESHYLSSRVISKRRLVSFYNENELSSSPSPKISKTFNFRENIDVKMQQMHDQSPKHNANLCDKLSFGDLEKEAALSNNATKQLGDSPSLKLSDPISSSLNETSYYPLDPFPLLSNKHTFFTSFLYKKLAEESRVYQIWKPTNKENTATQLNICNALNDASLFIESDLNGINTTHTCFTQYVPVEDQLKENSFSESPDEYIPKFASKLSTNSKRSSKSNFKDNFNDVELDTSPNSFKDESLYEYYPLNAYNEEDVETEFNQNNAVSPSYMDEDCQEQPCSDMPSHHSLNQFKTPESFKPKANKRPCTYFLEGNCLKPNCRFSHNLRTITCKFWLMNQCFKGDTCPFLHGYPPKKWQKKREKPEHTFTLESELDFPSLSSAANCTKDDEGDKKSSKKKPSKSRKT